MKDAIEKAVKDGRIGANDTVTVAMLRDLASGASPDAAPAGGAPTGPAGASPASPAPAPAPSGPNA